MFTIKGEMIRLDNILDFFNESGRVRDIRAQFFFFFLFERVLLCTFTIQTLATPCKGGIVSGFAWTGRGLIATCKSNRRGKGRC